MTGVGCILEMIMVCCNQILNCLKVQNNYFVKVMNEENLKEERMLNYGLIDGIKEKEDTVVALEKIEIKETNFELCQSTLAQARACMCLERL